MGIEDIQSGSSPGSSLSSGNSSLTNGTMAADIKEIAMLKGIEDWAADMMLNDQKRKIRQKLKTTITTKKLDDDFKRRPMVVKHPPTKHPTPDTFEVEENVQHGVSADKATRDVSGSCRRNCRTPSPSAPKSGPPFADCKAFTRRSHSIVGPRHRSPSTSRSRPSSPCSSVGSFRSPSPAGSLDSLEIEIVNKRIQKAYTARLYLLQQPGPHSFIVGGDSPENKFKTSIGPQTCTCGCGPHCIHILFVMLRVFKISENDKRLWSKQLKNFEVESLFAQYEKQRQSRIKSTYKSSKRTCTLTKDEDPLPSSQNMAVSKTPEKPKTDTHEDEGEVCPICLLDMVDGESLVSCISGCRNKLHHHCISIWAEECRRQREPFLCPLCRAPWKTSVSTEPETIVASQEVNDILENAAAEFVSVSTPPSYVATVSQVASQQPEPLLNVHVSAMERAAPHAHAVRPPVFSRSTSSVHLPCCHSVIGKEHSKMAALWGEVFGTEFVNCLYSREWVMRETALRWLHQKVLQEMMYPNSYCNNMSSGDGLGHSGIQDKIRCCCQILALVAADPVYRVYLACLQCLRMMLAHIPIKMETDLINLQDLIQPVVNTILLRCCDGTKASQLSIATLVEMCKGQSGEMAVGRHTPYPADVGGIGGVNFILRCVFDRVGIKGTYSWQWILGRLNVLEKLMEEYPQEFYLVLIPSNQKRCNSVDFSGLPIASRKERLLTLLHFALDALNISHAKVVKQAREVFFTAALFAVTVPSVLHQVYALAETNPLLKARLDTWLKAQLYGSGDHAHRRHSDEASLSIGFGFCSEFQRSFQSMVKLHPHLPSCGGVSPTKGLDRSYFMETLRTAGASDSPPPSNWRPNGSHGSAHKDKGMFVPSAPWMSHFCHQTTEGHSKCSKRSNAVHKRPNYLPLDGTFRDVLEWERVSGKPSSPTSGSKRYRSPTRMDRKPTSNRNSREPSCWKSHILPPTPNVVHLPGPPGAVGCGYCRPHVAVKKQPPASPLWNCPCGHDVTPPVMRKTSEQSRRSNMLGHKKLNGVLGPILPSLLSPGRLSKELPSEPPPAGRSFERTLDIAEASKNKPDVGFEEDVPVVKPFPDNMKSIVIPRLMQFDEDNRLVIHVEPDDPDEALCKPQSCAYVETVNWRKGILLGTGAFSTCYQARDLQTGTLMAVKQVSFCRNCPEDQEKVMTGIKEEIALMAQLDHPNIVRLLGATQQYNHFNMFVEWMPGGSVSCLLDKYGAFSEPVIINYTQQVLKGLAYLHDHQVLHRDLKGANLLVDSTGHNLRIGDFGAAARLASRATVAGEFQGQLLGTIAFMAPEVLRGDDYGRSCDIWSVGCAMIEMATTKPPWNSDDVSNHLALIYKIARTEESPPIPGNLSSSTRDLALRCLEIKSEARPPAKDLLKHPVFDELNP